MAYYDFETNHSQNLIRRNAYDKKNKIIFFNFVADTRCGISADVG